MILGFRPGPREEDPTGGRGANTLGSAPGSHSLPQAASTSEADLGPKEAWSCARAKASGGRPDLDPPGEPWSCPGPCLAPHQDDKSPT